MSVAVKRTIIIIGTILYSLIGFNIVSNPFELERLVLEYSLYFTTITTFVFIVWYGFIEGYENDSNLFTFLLIFFPIEIIALINIENFPFPNILFWLNLIIWVVASWIFTDSEDIEGFDFFLTYLFSTFFASVAYISIGHSPVFSYSIKPLEQISFINELIDIRFILGIIFILLITIKSVIITLKDYRPDLETIKPIDIDPNIENNFLKVFIPFVILFKIITNLFIAIINFIYLIVVITVIYLYKIGTTFGDNLLKILSKSFDLFKLIIIFILILFAAQFSRKLAPELYTYLTDNNILNYQFLWNVFKPILFIILCILGAIVTISINYRQHLKKKKNNFQDNLILKSTALTTISVMLWLSGFSLYLLSQIKYLQSIGFNRIGFYTLCLSSVIGIGLLIFIITKIVKRSIPIGSHDELSRE